MLVILSQKIDSESIYSDELFNSYHYPAKYKNQLHKGDTFIYYQGNRYDKNQRYYFGVGTVGEILTSDGENYYAKLIDCQQFTKKVPIYLPDGGYIEQLGYETIRKSQTPPWQSSIRPLSQEAFDYILNIAGVQQIPDTLPPESLDSLKEQLKNAVRSYYVDGDQSSIHKIESIASAIGRVTDINNESEASSLDKYIPKKTSCDRVAELLDYCRNMKMSYSYKPVLILALFHYGDKNGCITIERATRYFREYYASRKEQGLCVEKKKCIYLHDEVTDEQIIENVLSNPVKALTKSGLFFFNEETQVFSISPEIWASIERKSKMAITKICNQKLQDYYSK